MTRKVKRMIEKLEKLKEKEESIDDIIETVSHFDDDSFRMVQKDIEIRRLTEIVKSKVSPDVVVEIGTSLGGTFYLWCRALKTASQIYSIDLPGGPFGGGYPKEAIKFFKTFTEDKRLHFIRKNSHKEETIKSLKNSLGDKEIDFLFIDGDHSYDGVRRDFKLYYPLVRDGGIVAIHDIERHPEIENCEVDLFWDEIKGDYDTQELLQVSKGRFTWDYHWGGIGIIHK